MKRSFLLGETTPQARQRFYLLLTAATVAFVMLMLASPIAFPLDDAYITIHNAQALLAGADRNYHTPALAGATSLVHLLLVAISIGLSAPLTGSFLVSGVAILLYALGLARLTFQQGGTVILAVTMTTLGLFIGFAPLQLLNGLETGLAMAAVTWALIFALQPEPSKALPLLCSVLPYIRPELGGLSLLLMLRQCAIRLAVRNTSAMLTDCAVCLAGAAPWLIWQWTATASFIPLTATAKRAFFAEEGWSARQKLGTMLMGLLVSGLAPLCLTLPILRRTPLAACITAYTFFIFLGLYLVFPSGATQNCSRYLFILLPLLLYGLIGIVRQRPCMGRAILAVSLVSMFGCSRIVEASYKQDILFTNSELAKTAQWANAHLPPDAKILIHDAGYIAFATPFQLDDVVGLKTPANIHYFQNMPHTQAVGLIAQRDHPGYAIILHDQSHFWSRLENDLNDNGWRLHLLRAPTGKLGYYIYALTPPRAE